MLRTLELRSFALADHLEIPFGGGLNVLTGETGAGKSLVVDALQLLGGGRADSAFIRTGEESALVQATFEGGLGSAARRLTAAGRHTARIDGELVTVAELGERVGPLVAVFGQHAAQVLLHAASQRAQLDRLLAPGSHHLPDVFAELFATYESKSARLESLRQSEMERARLKDTLQYQLHEIDEAAPEEGEDEQLLAKLETLKHAERIAVSGSAALSALDADEPSATALLAAAARELRAAGKHSELLSRLADELDEAATAVGAVAVELEGFLEEFDADPGTLDDVQERLAALQRLKRKYGPELTDVLAFRADAAARLAELTGATGEIGALEHDLLELDSRLTTTGALLTEARQQAATELTRAAEPLLHELGMPHATFRAQLSVSKRRHRHGLDETTFLFSANAGEEPRPLADVASGGELSRVMLALNLVTGTDVPTLVFDEVDAGVGGKAADKVAVLLARLAQDHQVLVVTHLAQVAAHADRHFVVGKDETGGRTVTTVTRVDGEDRRAELARMLSGSESRAALEHAQELLERAAAT